VVAATTTELQNVIQGKNGTPITKQQDPHHRQQRLYCDKLEKENEDADNLCRGK